MAVTSIVSYQVKSGRDEEFIARMREAKAIVARLAVGQRSMRLWRATIAGANTGLYRASFEYDDLSSWAATLEREEHDAAFSETLKRAQSADSPASFAGRSLQNDLLPVAYASNSSAKGKIMQITAGHIKPGRMEDFVSRLADVNQFVLRSGALSARHTITIVGGQMTGLVVSFGEYADMGAFAEAWKRNDDPEWQALVKASRASDSPVTMEFQSILMEVQL